jgi:hypothetical protein
MDIRNVLKPVLPANITGVGKTERAIKSDSTTDRDGNGQMAGGGEQQKHHDPMDDEQFEKALEFLRSTSAVKENNLVVEKAVAEGKKVALIKDGTGKVIRRIMEAELWTLQSVKTDSRGQILSKTA